MLKIGWIDFLNTLPFNFEKAGINLDFEYELIKDVPSKLNKFLRKGEIDIGIVSSAEYLENFDKYLILPDLSISAKGRVFSVSVFSNIVLDNINEIYLTKASKSSRYLTKIVFENFLKKNVAYKELENFENIQNKSVLLIGDNAIFMKDRFKYCYDLSEIWYKYTNLPFVFALWVLRKDTFLNKKYEILKFYNALKKTQKIILKNIDNFILSEYKNKDFVKFYLKNLDYSLKTHHLEGLKKFSDYLLEANLINKKPHFNFITF